MRKIIAVFATALAILLSTYPATAQEPGKVYRIGFLMSVSVAAVPMFVNAFRKGLRDLGYIEGRTVTIEYREAEGRRERLPGLAADLVRQKVDIILCTGAGAQAALKATSTIPIVVAVAAGYVARGWAKSLRRPGGNLTGLSTQAFGLMGKQLQLLKETAPNLSRVAILHPLGHPTLAIDVRQAKEAAPALGLDVVGIAVKGADGLPGVFRRMKAEGIDGIVVLRSGFFLRLRGRMTTLAREAGLPTLFGHRVEVAAGGLMAYGAETKALFYGAASYVDKILKGADPAELPISQATKFKLTVNLKTAKALGITVPPSILLRADQVIE